MPEGLTPQEIDDFVGAALAAGEDLYRLDAGALAELDADLVVTQDLCAVCAIDVSTVDDALAHLGCRADVATIDPHTLADVLASIADIGRRTDKVEEAATLIASLEERLAAVEARVAGRPRPRVLVLEWTDPPFAPGHWIPEMVTRAGGEPTLGVAGTRSSRITWEDAVDSGPDLVVCAPCGFDLDGEHAARGGSPPPLPGGARLGRRCGRPLRAPGPAARGRRRGAGGDPAPAGTPGGGPPRRRVILPKVRDPRLVTVRRGGSLIDEHHRLLAMWAAECAEHVLPLFETERPDDARPREAIDAARTWAAAVPP